MCALHLHFGAGRRIWQTAGLQERGVLMGLRRVWGAAAAVVWTAGLGVVGACNVLVADDIACQGRGEEADREYCPSGYSCDGARCRKTAGGNNGGIGMSSGAPQSSGGMVASGGSSGNVGFSSASSGGVSGAGSSNAASSGGTSRSSTSQQGITSSGGGTSSESLQRESSSSSGALTSTSLPGSTSNASGAASSSSSVMGSSSSSGFGGTSFVLDAGMGGSSSSGFGGTSFFLDAGMGGSSSSGVGGTSFFLDAGMGGSSSSGFGGTSYFLDAGMGGSSSSGFGGTSYFLDAGMGGSSSGVFTTSSSGLMPGSSSGALNTGCDPLGNNFDIFVGSATAPTITAWQRSGTVRGGRVTAYPEVRDLAVANGNLVALTGGAMGALYLVTSNPTPPLIAQLPPNAEGTTPTSPGEYGFVFSSASNNLEIWTEGQGGGTSYTHLGRSFYDVEVDSASFAMTDPAFGVVVAPLIMPMFETATVPLPGALGLTVLQGNVLLVTNAANVFTVNPVVGTSTVWTSHVDLTNPVAVHKTPDNTVLVLNGSPARVVEFSACGLYRQTITLTGVTNPRSVVAIQVL